MEILDRIQDLFVNYWHIVLAWLSMIPAGAIVWKVGTILVKLIQNGTAKKYTQKTKALVDELKTEIAGIKDFVKQEIKNEVEFYSKNVKQTFNNLQEKELETKGRIYDEIFNEEMKVEEIIEETKAEIVEDIKEAEKQVEEEQKMQETEQIIEEVAQIVEEPKEEKVDLL